MALDIVRAESVSQAAGILAGDDGAHFLGGGTFLVRAMTACDLPIRKFVLADGLEVEGATLANGLLRIDLRRRSQTLEIRQIPITSQ